MCRALGLITNTKKKRERKYRNKYTNVSYSAPEKVRVFSYKKRKGMCLLMKR
jgi:hypothetical protein